MRLRGIAFVVLAIANFVAAPALACGLFVGPRKGDDERARQIPYLHIEQVLLLWDERTETEDFIRETHFERASSSFGFVVPVPSKPEVAAVAEPPFTALRASYPFSDDEAVPAGGGLRHGPRDAGVEIVAQQRIGRFTAFTLSASDTGAFDRWLGDNGFAMSSEARPWLEHYVRLKFYFVAFKYDGADAGAMSGRTSETVRLRFKTPHPYYPYAEPAHPMGAPRPRERRLSGWLVTREAAIDVAFRAPDHWGRPFELGTPTNVRSNVVAPMLGDLGRFVPAGANLVVLPFRDRKLSRAGFGDVLFVPPREVTYRPDQVAAREHLLGVIDPRLVDDPVDAGLPTPDPPPPPERPRARCSASPGAGDPCLWPLVVGALALLRRRRAIALSLLVACGRPPSTTDAGSDASPPSDRRLGAIAILSGRHGHGEALVQDNDPYDDGLRPNVVLLGEPSLALDGLRPALRACFQDGLREDPSIEGEISFDVASMTPTATGHLPEAVVACAAKAIRELRLDPRERGTRSVAKYRLTVEER